MRHTGTQAVLHTKGLRPNYTRQYSPIHTIRDFLFPQHCIGCKRPGAWLCQRCISFALVRSNPECMICRRYSPGYRTHASCKGKTVLARTVICWQYNYLGKQIMHVFKFKYRYSIAEQICFLASEILKPFIRNDMVFVPVPSTSKRVRERGFNQTYIIASLLGAMMNIQTADILRKSPDTKAQSQKTRGERLELTDEQFTLTQHGKRLDTSQTAVLVDDVCTTGSTLNACALALSKAGFRNIMAVALFRGSRPFKRR